MPRNYGNYVENNFTNGLVTEATGLNFPEGAVTDCMNVVFNEDGSVSRRKALDYERDYTLNTQTISTDAVVEFLWTAVAGQGSIEFVVQQIGNTIRFYRVDVANGLSSGLNASTISLLDFDVSGAPSPRTEPCGFSSGKGYLFVTHKYCEPFYVSYDTVGDTFSGTAIEIEIRDFEGVEDNLEIDERPTTQTTEHKYNLFNQGWYPDNVEAANWGITDLNPLWIWDFHRSDFPNNSDVWWLLKDTNEVYNRKWVDRIQTGTTPAPKGHYLLNAFNQKRGATKIESASVAAPGIVTMNTVTPHIAIASGTVNVEVAANADFDCTGAVVSSITDQNTFVYQHPYTTRGTGTVFDLSAGVETFDFLAAHGLVTGQPIKVSSTGTLPTGLIAGTVYYAIVVDADTIAFATSEANADANTRIDLTGAPTGTVTVTATIDSAETATSGYVYPGFTNVTSSYYRPTDSAFFAGRVFYGGVDYEGFNGLIYFSQIIERDKQFGNCYQVNDPTAEDNSDLLPSDGGTIKILDAGTIVKLFPTQKALIAFATNGIWSISGSDVASFSAEDYTVKKIASIPMYSSLSVVDVFGVPFFWSRDGIWTLAYEGGDFTPQPVSDKKVKTFIEEVPFTSIDYIKGVFDPRDRVIYWLYNNDEPDTVYKKYRYNRALCLQVATGAFYPFSFSEGAISTVHIKGAVVCASGDYSTGATAGGTQWTFGDSVSNVLKLFAVKNTSGTDYTTAWAEFSSVTYLDWDADGEDYNYSSYLFTGYKVAGEGNKEFQSNYITFHLKDSTGSSAFVRGCWDYTNNALSIKWTTAQQMYNSTPTYRDFRIRKLKIRGWGKSLQLYIYSESGKPFEIAGWSVFVSGNTLP